MHSPSSSAAPLLVFMWCCGQVIKGVGLTEKEWPSARLSPGLCQCRLRPVPGEGQGGRGVPLARDCAVTYPGSHLGLHCLPCAVKPHPWASELFLLQNYFCFDSSSLVPTQSKKLKSRVLLLVIVLAADLLTWKTFGAECLPWGCGFRWDSFIALPFVPSTGAEPYSL